MPLPGEEPIAKRIKYDNDIDVYIAERSYAPRVLVCDKSTFTALSESYEPLKEASRAGRNPEDILSDFIVTLVHLIDGPDGAKRIIDMEIEAEDYVCNVAARPDLDKHENIVWWPMQIKLDDGELVLSIFFHNNWKDEEIEDVLEIEHDDDKVDLRVVYYLTIDDRWKLGKCTFGWMFKESERDQDQGFAIRVAAKMVLQKIVERMQ